MGLIISDPREYYMEVNYHNNTVNYSDSEKYEFCDVITLYKNTQKYIYICERKDTVYLCPTYGLESFDGLRRYLKKDIRKVVGKLSDKDKNRLVEILGDSSYTFPNSAKDGISKILKNKE